MNSENTCCDSLFSKFDFKNIRDAEPPKRKGVYVIQIKKRGKPIKEIVAQVTKIVGELNWSIVGEMMLNRIHRLENINSCPVIYIGSAGTQNRSNNTLKGRYKDFAGRHTAMYPLWALLYFGWELEYGWRGDEKPGDVEEHLKKKYKDKHQGALPALVRR